MNATYIEDWDEEVHGKFPVRSRKFMGKRKVRLQSDRGIWAGYCTSEERQIGKEFDVDEEMPPNVVFEEAQKDGKTITRKRALSQEERDARPPPTKFVDTRRTLPARYVRIALVEPSESEVQRLQAERTVREQQDAQEASREGALDSLRSKRENSDPLTQADMELMADLLTGRL